LRTNVVLHYAKKRNTVMHRYVSVLPFLLSVMPLGWRELHFSFFRLLAELTGNFHRELGVYSSGGSGHVLRIESIGTGRYWTQYRCYLVCASPLEHNLCRAELSIERPRCSNCFGRTTQLRCPVTQSTEYIVVPVDTYETSCRSREFRERDRALFFVNRFRVNGITGA
jgi:hypothetical protein